VTVPVSSYPSEFASAPTPYEAVEPSVFLGLPPLLILLLLAAAVAAAAAAYYAGRQGVRDGGFDDAAKEIHTAILAYARMAMTAESGELRSRVEALREALRRLLGPVLDLAKGVDGPVKQIDEALKGELKVEPKTERHDHKPHQPPASPQPVVNQILIGVAPNAPAAETHRHDEPRHAERPHDAEKPKPETRKMTAEEQTDALARAARAFHDHWARPQRIQELKDARRALSTRPPAPPKSPEERKRVWDRL
jgi:hypothetical protein